MNIVAHQYEHVIGVDTHARTNTFAILSAGGEHIDTATFPNTAAGNARAIAWAHRRTNTSNELWSVEGAASYGSALHGALTTAALKVVEAPRVNARSRHGYGKSDPLDANAIAAVTLTTKLDHLRNPRTGDGPRQALRVLGTARDDLTSERTRKRNALNALLRTNQLGVDARLKVNDNNITIIAKWRARSEPVERVFARQEAVRLATRLMDIDRELAANEHHLTALLKTTPAAALLDERGIGPVTAATVYTAYSHPGRLRNEAAFAALAGVSPIPASSGNTVRYRLNRGGDRRINRALHLAVNVKMVHDPATRAYVERRTLEGRTKKEIRRSLKRYLARRIFRILQANATMQIAT